MTGLGLGLGLGLAQRATGVQAWTPAQLFVGQDGLWLDPSNLGTMRQGNTVGSTAAAVDAEVGYIADRSGNGRTLTQATSSLRPILRESGGLYYLDFDGTDDRISLTFGATVAQPNYIAVAVQYDVVPTALGTDRYAFASPITGSRHDIVPVNQALSPIAGNSPASDKMLADTNAHVIGAQFNGASSNIRLDGVDSAVVDAGAQAMGGARLGSSFVPNNFLNGRVYGVIVMLGVIPSEATKDLIDTYLGAKAGLVL